MNALVLTVLLVPLPTPAPGPAVDADDKRMQGEWLIVSLSEGRETLAGQIFLVTGSTMARVEPNGKKHEATFRLDPAKKQITVSEGKKTYSGSYELTKDSLRISLSDGDTPPGAARTISIVLKRK